MARESKITVATGEKGGGKTYTTLWEIVVPCAKGLLNGGRPRKALIYDSQDEYGFTSNTDNNIYPKAAEHKKMTNGKPVLIKAINANDVEKWSKQNTVEIRRISPRYTDDVYDKKGNLIAKRGSIMSPQDKVKNLIIALEGFNDGLFVIEDLRKLFGNNIPHHIVDAIVSNRHNNLDIVWHLQSAGRMLPEFWENVNIVRFHNEKGSIDYHEGKLQEKYEMFKICDILVNKMVNGGNIHYYVWCDNDRKKIIGRFTNEQILWCIEKYIKLTPASISAYQREKDDNGKNLYTFSQCIEMKKRELFNNYISIK